MNSSSPSSSLSFYTVVNPIAPNVQIAHVQQVAASETPSKLENLFAAKMALAEEQFNNYASLTSEQKNKFVDLLGEAYKDLHSLYTQKSVIPLGIERQAASLFYMYGRTLYPDMPPARRMFQMALAVDFVSLNIINGSSLHSIAACNSLTALPAHLEQMGAKAAMELDQILMETPIAKLIGSIPEQASLAIGIGARWLGHCYQNLTAFNDATAENMHRFDQIYGLSKAAMEKSKHAGANIEIAELLYNTTRFMFNLRNPNDPIGKLATLKQLEPYLAKENGSPRAVQMGAQIHNITAMETYALAKAAPSTAEKVSLLKTCFESISAAYKLASSRADFNSQLKSFFLNNRAAFALELLDLGAPAATIQEIESWNHEARAFALKEAEGGKNHFYFAGFFNLAAKLALRSGNLELAKQHLDAADGINAAFAASSKPFKEATDDLRAKLLAASPKE